MLLGAWLLHSVRLAAALGMAIVAMQAPAVTRDYQAAPLHLVRSSGEDIAPQLDLSFAVAIYGPCGLIPGLADRWAGNRRIPFPAAPYRDMSPVAVRCTRARQRCRWNKGPRADLKRPVLFLVG
jgi:hypothetical protein